jgi:hypothetical protein
MSDISSVEYVNIPDDMPRLIPVGGNNPKTVYEVDYQNQPDVNVHALHTLGTAQVKLAVASSDFEGEREEDLQEALDIINDVIADVADDYADRDSHKWYDLYMGNLDELPGVDKRVEQ